MANNLLPIPDLTDDETILISSTMISDKLLAYGLLDETKSDQLWENLSCHPMLATKSNGQIWKASWEKKVDDVYKKQFIIMTSDNGYLTDIEQQVLSAIVEEDFVPPPISAQEAEKSTTDTVSAKRSIETNYHTQSKRVKKMDFQKQGLEAMDTGNELLETVMVNLIRLSNNRNRVISIGMSQAIDNIQVITQQLDEYAKKKKK